MQQRKFSTRENSAFKWKQDRTVVGALEVKSFPLNLEGKMKEHFVNEIDGSDPKDAFLKCLKLWKELNLHKEFAQAASNVPPETSCCGLLSDDDGTVRKLAPFLNAGWVKGVNHKFREHGYKISSYVWSWTNPTGKSETVVLMLRFHIL